MFRFCDQRWNPDFHCGSLLRPPGFTINAGAEPWFRWGGVIRRPRFCNLVDAEGGVMWKQGTQAHPSLAKRLTLRPVRCGSVDRGGSVPCVVLGGLALLK
jgi:hypothetical protein